MFEIIEFTVFGDGVGPGISGKVPLTCTRLQDFSGKL